ncbi:hypothetical protein E2C01_101124 [Portunus trituberculatus]|uniref:Uncharacterized protein n=1 Tax=Portunus trituberculatus TaxID=210409 RepID=A0A5B7KF21_PORTR|nr:hypothetical protein [Portunus trituberculatus]
MGDADEGTIPAGYFMTHIVNPAARQSDSQPARLPSLPLLSARQQTVHLQNNIVDKLTITKLVSSPF